MVPATDANKEEKDVKWTDAQIRWPEDKVSSEEGTAENNNEGGNENPFDPFADPDPHEMFSFRFVTTTNKKRSSTVKENPKERLFEDDNDNESIRMEIHGYKTDSDQVWESTGLTLWKASKYLCDFMVKHAGKLKGQRILEVSRLLSFCCIVNCALFYTRFAVLKV